MGKAFPVIAALLVGVALAVQGPINSELSRHVGQIRAVLISVLVSATTVVLVLLVAAGPGSFGGLAQTPRWALIGGLFGVVSLLGTIIAVPRIGVVATTSAVIAAQLIGSAVVDHFGLLGVTVRRLTPIRVSGLLLLVVAVLLVTRA